MSLCNKIILRNNNINHVILSLEGYTILLIAPSEFCSVCYIILSSHHTYVTNGSVYPGTRLSLLSSRLFHSYLGSTRSPLNKTINFAYYRGKQCWYKYGLRTVFVAVAHLTQRWQPRQSHQILRSRKAFLTFHFPCMGRSKEVAMNLYHRIVYQLRCYCYHWERMVRLKSSFYHECSLQAWSMMCTWDTRR